MKLPTLPLSLMLVLVCFFSADAQKRKPNSATSKLREIGNTALVIDETLSVLRVKPSLFADSLRRLRRGGRVQILGSLTADGVRFYKVAASQRGVGWIQSDAVFGRFRPDDESRFARLIQATGGFAQIELATIFLEMYPKSQFRPAILLLYGDLLEGAAAKLSRDASSRLDRREMAASGAPLHSYYLNFNMLDRYRRLGVRFLFNGSTRMFHYNGASWKEIVQKYSMTRETPEAQKRLDSLKLKIERLTAS